MRRRGDVILHGCAACCCAMEAARCAACLNLCIGVPVHRVSVAGQVRRWARDCCERAGPRGLAKQRQHASTDDQRVRLGCTHRAPATLRPLRCARSSSPLPSSSRRVAKRLAACLLTARHWSHSGGGTEGECTAAPCCTALVQAIPVLPSVAVHASACGPLSTPSCVRSTPVHSSGAFPFHSPAPVCVRKPEPANPSLATAPRSPLAPSLRCSPHSQARAVGFRF